MTATREAPVRTQRASFGGTKRWLARARLAVGALLVAYILLLVNFVSFRHPLRFDWTSERINSLTPATLDKLRLVGQEIRVVYPKYLLRDSKEHVAFREVLDRARALLDEFMAVQPLIKVAAEMDVFADPEKWVEARDRFHLDSSQVNRFIFLAGPGNDLRQALTPQDLAIFGKTRDPRIEVPEIKAFLGEKAMADAVARLIAGKRKRAYFTQDHGEAVLKPQNQAPSSPAAMNALLHELDTAGFEARELSLSAAKEAPEDCALLVVAGATQPFSQNDLGLIDRYLQRDGKLLVTLRTRATGIEGLLEAWGIKALDGTVQGRIVIPPNKVMKSGDVSCRAFNRVHPVTKPFETVERFELELVTPRALADSGKGHGLDVMPIVDAQSKENESYFLVPDRQDLPLPAPADHTVAMAAAQIEPERPPPGFQRIQTRVLVVGATSFLTDQHFLRGSHRDFLMNAVAWLSGEEERATVGGQAWVERRLRSSPQIDKFLFWVPIFLLPGVFLCLGVFVYYLRRT